MLIVGQGQDDGDERVLGPFPFLRIGGRKICPQPCRKAADELPQIVVADLGRLRSSS